MKSFAPVLAVLAVLTASVAAPVQAQPTAAQATARAQPTAPDAVAPKVAIVVVGDADERTRAAALRVEEALSVGGALRLPEDVGLRAALRGEQGPAEDDGLASVRRARRALGLGEAEDAPNLARLGRMAGATLVVAVRPDGHGGVEMVTLQVAAAQFYEGSLDAEHAEPERLSRAVKRRALHAATGAASEASTRTRSARARRAPAAATAPDEPREEQSFLEKSWPYLVAGALLAGFVTYIVIDASSGNETAQTPVLRFSPGP